MSKGPRMGKSLVPIAEAPRGRGASERRVLSVRNRGATTPSGMDRRSERARSLFAGPGLLATVLLSLAAGAAHAQDADVDLDRGPSAEIYIRKRPATPEAPSLSPELQALLIEAEAKRDAKRAEAIGLLRTFLDGKPEGSVRAEGLFKLGELLWEDARRVYLENIDAFEHEAERCKEERCKHQPKEPRIDLSESEAHFRTLIVDHPDFVHMDLVLYLVGFAAKEDEREDEALAMFERVIADYPSSPLFGDAWMMIGEHWFAAEKWEEARAAYKNILARPNAPTYDLALFKTGWCDWKLGDIALATEHLGALLQPDERKTGSRTASRRAKGIRDEALEYLVVIFTEDRSISAKEVYDFLASVGGEQYSHDLLVKVAEAYYGQAEYERSADTYRFLIELDGSALSAAAWQRKILENWVAALDGPTARSEMEILVNDFGPASKWAKAQHGNAEALAKQLAATEQLVRVTATNYHAEAQAEEDRMKKPDLAMYQVAADSYRIYLSGFGGKDAGEPAIVVRGYLGDILYFKLKQYELAGDEYLAVGKSAPVTDGHKDALKKAMTAFEAARPKNTAGQRELLPVDRKFAEAMDLYATLFPADPELVGLIFKNGQLFYDYGDYDEAIKRFGLIVTKYPDDPNALAAGDHILAALDKAKDYENIEEWARRLKNAKAFASKEEQARLDKIIVDAIGASGEKYADAGKYDQAAGFYLRIPKEFPKHAKAPTAMQNAGVMYERAKKPEQAAEVYLELAERYPSTEEGGDAAFTAGRIYEKVAYFDRAAEAYELAVAGFDKKKDRGDEDAASALYNAGYLRQSLGEYDKAIKHYELYAKRFKDRKDAAEVAFRIGAVYEETGDDGRADQAFREFAKAHKGHRLTIQAHVRAGRSSVRLGQLKRGAEQLKTALDLYKKAGASDKAASKAWAAEARYWQGELLFGEYAKVSLAVKPNALDRTLKKKTDLLLKAKTVYFSVIDYQDLRWATAALFRVGQTFELYAEELRNAPTPTDLSEAEAEAYRGALDMTVVDIEEQAITLYATGYQKAIEMQVYDQSTAKIREALGRLSPDEYPPEREGRGDERIGDRPLGFPILKEVMR